jgi:FMN-dependent NADH-azoreductase
MDAPSDDALVTGDGGSTASGSPAGPVLLHVDSSPRAASATRALTAAYVAAWLDSHPDGTVRRHDLPVLNLPHLNATEMGAWFASPDEHTDLHRLVLARSDTLIDDVLAADEIVVGAPMWNFSIPSSLKAWIDHVTKVGRTLRLGPEGPYGIVTAARAVVVVSRGSEYGPGLPTEALDHQVPYLRLILGFLGIRDVRVVTLDGQGPTYPDAAETFAVAEAEVRALALERDAPQPA